MYRLRLLVCITISLLFLSGCVNHKNDQQVHEMIQGRYSVINRCLKNDQKQNQSDSHHGIHEETRKIELVGFACEKLMVPAFISDICSVMAG